jgi:hypothetical protein
MALTLINPNILIKPYRNPSEIANDDLESIWPKKVVFRPNN